MAAPTTVDTLLDILELIQRIERQTKGLTAEQFIADNDVLDATAYRILAIGESSRDLAVDLQARHPQIPWRQITAMRNFSAHEYFLRESEIIWETVKVGLPELAGLCRTELARPGWSEAREET